MSPEYDIKLPEKLSSLQANFIESVPAFPEDQAVISMPGRSLAMSGQSFDMPITTERPLHHTEHLLAHTERSAKLPDLGLRVMAVGASFLVTRRVIRRPPEPHLPTNDELEAWASRVGL